MISSETLELLDALEVKAISSHNLAELVLSQYGPLGILDSSSIRQELLQHLPVDEATDLQSTLGLVGENPYEAIGSAAFSKRSNSLTVPP